MKLVAPLLLAATLWQAAAVRAQDAAAPDAAAPPTVAPDAAPTTIAQDKPYASIVARNMFGLLPIPTHDPAADLPPEEPPPKITPNGIMTIFGHLEALFKVAVKPKPGQPAKDQAYTLREGERLDDIEVLKINKEEAIVTFNNHGKIQELPLVVAANTTAPAGGPGGGPGPGNPALGGQRQPMSPADRAARFTRPSGGAPNPTTPGNPGMSGSQARPGQPNFGNLGNGGFQQPGQQMGQQPNIEDQVMNTVKTMAQVELNRIATQEAVDKGLMPPLPPTMLTPPDAHVGPLPLVNQPPPPPVSTR